MPMEGKRMIDVSNTTDLLQRLAGVSLDELRVLHGRVVDSDRLLRGLIREKEALARRDARLRERGLSIAGTPA